MQFKFFKISTFESEPEAGELNRFLACHSIINIDTHFISNDNQSFWAICVSYSNGLPVNSGEKKSKIDYRLILDENDFTVFAKLRELRKNLAQKEGTPPYNLFTNEQLSKMVQERMLSMTKLETIDGVGSVRAKKYGQLFIDLMSEEFDRIKALNNDK